MMALACSPRVTVVAVERGLAVLSGLAVLGGPGSKAEFPPRRRPANRAFIHELVWVPL
jgi:hypothetical protein